jgi:hypothetical protein
MRYIFMVLLVALSMVPFTAWADPSPTATATLLNDPQYGGYATIHVVIDGHVKYPAGVVWCSQYEAGTRVYHGYWEHHYSTYRNGMDVTVDYGPFVSPNVDSVDLEGTWRPDLVGSCSFILFAEAQGKNGKGPFAIDGGWFPFTVEGVN